MTIADAKTTLTAGNDPVNASIIATEDEINVEIELFVT